MWPWIGRATLVRRHGSAVVSVQTLDGTVRTLIGCAVIVVLGCM